MARALDAILATGGRLLIIRDAFDGLRCFSEIQANLGIAKGDALGAAARSGRARRAGDSAPASDGSAYQEYVLTRKGRDLFFVIVALRQWGEGHLFERDEPHSVFVDVDKPAVLLSASLIWKSRDGRSLRWKDTRVRKVGAG